MKREEIEKAVEKGDSVWVVFNQYSYENDSVKEIDFTKVECVELRNNYFQYFNDKKICGHRYELIFKTKAEAEHYLHHANVVRTEELPFLTWEEFLKKEHINFNNGKEGFSLYISYINCDHIRISTYDRYNPDGDVVFEAPLIEANFYKAYDECVRLFKEGE